MWYWEFELHTRYVYISILECNKFYTNIHWNLIHIISFFARSQSGTWAGSNRWGWFRSGISISISSSRGRRSLNSIISFCSPILTCRSILIWSISICYTIWYGCRYSSWRWCISSRTNFLCRWLRRSKRWRTTVLSFSLVLTKSCGKIYFETYSLVLFYQQENLTNTNDSYDQDMTLNWGLGRYLIIWPHK